MSKKEMERLFAQYMEVCNKAAAAHQNDFPYKQFWETGKKIFKNGVDIAIIDDTPQLSYHIDFEDKSLKSKKINPEDAKREWVVNLSYLKKVVENPEDYIKNPTKLDWHWLKNRLGGK